MSKFRLLLKNFKAVHKADITMDGITVLAGVNSSGKSTVSRFFYHFLKENMGFDRKSNEEFLRFIERIYRTALRALEFDNELRTPDDIRDIRHRRYSLPKSVFTPEQAIKFLKEFFDELSDSQRRALDLSGIQRLLREEGDSSVQLEELTYEKIVEELFCLIERKKVRQQERIKKRERQTIVREIEEHLSGVSTCSFDVFMDNVSLMRDDSIEDIEAFVVEYIDPMHNNRRYYEWMHKYVIDRRVLSSSGKSKSIDGLFTSEKFLDGVINTTGTGIVYQRGDDIFPIEECASGVNCVVDLYLLYKHGYINKDSVIIIDEPEVHLHPQWIPEYARVIVFLTKKCNATFLIATHSPDMVSALKYISEKEKLESRLNFYLAERVETSNTYEFIHKEQEIEDIFASFNISMDRIHEYSHEAEE